MFGGSNSTRFVNTWQYISISNLLREESIDPTPSPTQYPIPANPTMTEETINTSVILNMLKMTIPKEKEVMEDVLQYTTSRPVEDSTDINDFVVIILTSVGGICLCGMFCAFIICRKKYQQKLARDNIKNLSNKNIAPELNEDEEKNAAEDTKLEDAQKIGNIYIEENINTDDVYMDNSNMMVEGRVDNDRYNANGIEGELITVKTIGEEQPHIGDV